jgi:xylulokinase
VLIGIDMGTSSSKGVLVSPEGTVVANEVCPHGVSTPRPGWVQHDALDVWWADFVAIARSLVEAADGRPIAALGVSGIGPCLLPADSGGRPLRPAILYGVDTRATAEIDLLASQFGASSILARGGTALSGRT